MLKVPARALLRLDRHEDVRVNARVAFSSSLPVRRSYCRNMATAASSFDELSSRLSNRALGTGRSSSVVLY